MRAPSETGGRGARLAHGRRGALLLRVLRRVVLLGLLWLLMLLLLLLLLLMVVVLWWRRRCGHCAGEQVVGHRGRVFVNPKCRTSSRSS